MPTGYTAPVEDGDITDLRDYAARCARAFGVFIHQRDDGLDARLSYPESPENSYYNSALQRARARAIEWESMGEEAKYAEWSTYYKETLVANAESEARRNLHNSRYDAMLAQIHGVDVDSKLENFKKFMISQLEESKYSSYTNIPMEYVAWCEQQEDSIIRDLNYYPEQIAKEQERYEDRVSYINLMVETFGFEVVE